MNETATGMAQSIVRDVSCVDDAEKRRLKSRVLGDFETLVIYVDMPLPGEKRWRLVSRSDLPEMPPGIAANVPMEDSARTFNFFMDVCGEYLHACIFAKVEAGKSLEQLCFQWEKDRINDKLRLL